MLLGKAALANYHDVEDGAWEEFNAWHTNQHLPERVSVPGFLRGRRYARIRGGPQFFILYETETLSVLRSPPYLERLNSPTDWTRNMSRAATMTVRTAARVTASLGTGVGGTAMTWRLSPLPGRADELREWLSEHALPSALGTWGLVGAHLLEADSEVSRVATVESSIRPGGDQIADWIILIEGTGEAPIQAVAKTLEEPAMHGAAPRQEQAFYRLQTLLARAEVGGTTTIDQPAT